MKNSSTTAAWLIAVLLTLGRQVHGRAEVVTLRLLDGREVSGELDSRTDEMDVWLSTTEGRTTVVSAFSRSQIIDQRAGSPLPKGIFVGPAAVPFELQMPVNEAMPVDVPAVRVAGRIRSIELRASIANFDADDEVDGLRVFIYPLDQYGQVVTTRCNVVATMSGFRKRKDTKSRDRLRELEYWTRVIKPDGNNEEGIMLELPYKRREDYDRRTIREAILTVQLTAAGHGVYRGRMAIPLHEFSPLEDTLSLYDDRRRPVRRSVDPVR